MREHDRIVLAVDLPELKLVAGDVGTIVHLHAGSAAYEVEFVALDGETVAVATLSASQVRAIEHREIVHARSVA